MSKQTNLNEILERLRRSKGYAEKLVSETPSLKRTADQLDDASRLLLTKGIVSLNR
jgi:hypothetical protein